MSSTTFVDGVTTILSSWLNDVNTETYVNTHVNSLTGTSGQVNVSSSTGNPTISLPSTLTGVSVSGSSGSCTGAAATAGSATNAINLITTNFSIKEVSGKLYFYYGTTQIASMDSSGNFTALATITSAGTP